jgi:sugar phosphate isomerase/epimerase
MIYISSACIGNKNIFLTLEELKNNSIRNIELTGGTDYKSDLNINLLSFKKSNNINILLHNYYPPPKSHFVKNLASLDKNIFNKSFEHSIAAIELTSKLGGDKYGVHAGFLIDMETNELGQIIKKKKLLNKEIAVEKFIYAISLLTEIAAENNVKLYVENNVISHSNFLNFNANPFLLTCLKDYKELNKLIEFNLLLDVAHLKVSSNVLGLNFNNEMDSLMDLTDYVHISDNDSFADQNKGLSENGSMYKLLKKYNYHKKTITLEIYEDINVVNESYELINKMINS